MSDNGIVWEDPPRAGNYTVRNDQYRAILEEVAQHPGKWARIGECPTNHQAASLAGNLRRSVYKPAGEWKFLKRSKDGHQYVYALYLGPS